MSVPDNAGLSCTTQKRSGSGASARTFWSRTTRMPSGTSTTWARSRSAASRSSSAASRVSDGWPLFSAALGDLIERIEPRPVGGAVVAITLRIAPRGLPHRLKEPRDRLLLIGVLIGIGLAVLIEQIGFPVIEEQLRRRPHLLSRSLGVLDPRQIDLDLVPTGLQQLRLRHPERVHPLAHDVQRPLQRLRRNRRLLRRRLGLVHQLHPALQIQPQLGIALIEHRKRRGDQPQHEEQNEQGAMALGHAAPSGLRGGRLLPVGGTDPTGKDPRAVESWLGMDAKRRGALGMQRFDST